MVMGMGNEAARLAERVVYWEMLLCEGRRRRDSVVMAWKSWVEGGGKEESGGVGGVVGGEGQGWAKGALAASLLRRLGDIDLRFFLRMCWEWVAWSSVERSSSKGGERGLISDGQPKTRPHVYTQSFLSSSTATKIEEAGGSIPSFSS